MSLIRLVLAGFAAFILLAALAIFYFGVWGILGVIVAAVIAFQVLKRLAGTLALKLFMTPFKAKGAVLHNADLRVLSVTPAAAPPREHCMDGDSDTSEPVLDWYEFDVTVTPKPGGGPFQFWEPSEMVLVGPDAKPDELEDSGQEAGRIHSLQIWSDGQWTSDEVGKYHGPQRLKLHAGIEPGAQRVRLRYYFEIFGQIELPAAHTFIG